MARYLVTGADGFIASHLCDYLLSVGHEVVAFCRYHSDLKLKNLKTNPKMTIVWGDCVFNDTVRQIPGGRYDGVFHLAAFVDVAWSLALNAQLNSESIYYIQNVIGTKNMATFAQRHGARFLLMSTSEVYGTPQVVPIQESDDVNPQSPYAHSKVMAELCVRAMYKNGYDCVIARTFNTYGPRQSRRAVLSKICSVKSTGAEKIELGDVDTKRDWMYVSDTVAGLLSVMELGLRGEVYNLGTGSMYTVRQACNMAGFTDEQIVSGTGQNRGGAEVLMLQADIAKSKGSLAWEPTVTLGDGLKKTIEWEVSNAS